MYTIVAQLRDATDSDRLDTLKSLLVVSHTLHNIAIEIYIRYPGFLRDLTAVGAYAQMLAKHSDKADFVEELNVCLSPFYWLPTYYGYALMGFQCCLTAFKVVARAHGGVWQCHLQLT